MPTDRTLSSIPANFVDAVSAQLPDLRGDAGPICIIEGNNRMRVGANVHVIDEIYLTTDPNSTTRDNLESLPRF